ncbi:MAG: serine/threonine-protein phosphatase [Prevotella sp.]|nr:serine/threonine-protein phosphatase [Prevotella sp.]
MSKFNITAASRVGCIRSNNEDMVLVWDRYIRNDAYRTVIDTASLDRFVIALADGMGGHNAGEVASQEVLANLHFFINDLPSGMASGDFYETICEWLNSVNIRISTRGLANPELSEMGTTLVGIICYDRKFYWINCGDSRLYRFRNGELKQLTTDHSLNNMTGTKRHSNIITNCIGAGCKTSFIDQYEFTDDVQSGDVYVICSDGLNDMVPDEHIQQVLGERGEANELCQAAIDAGGYDNVSVCVIKVD